MKINALLVLEIGFDQSKLLEKILYKNKFKLKDIIKDISGNKRIMIAISIK